MMRRLTLSVTTVLLMMMGGASAILAQQPADIELEAQHLGIEIDPAQQRVDLDLVFYNHGDAEQVVRFELEDVPEGWNVGVWMPNFQFRLTEYAVEPTAEQPDRIQQARLRIEPPADVEPGGYGFTLRVLSQDGTVLFDEARYTITTREGLPDEPGDISFVAEPPALQGEPGASLAFEVTARNQTEEEATVELSADAPSEWEVRFLEPFGEQRAIGAVGVPEEQLERFTVEVFPPLTAEMGEHSITVTGQYGDQQVSIDLLAEITGHGELEISPRTQLDTQVTAGRATTANLILANPGTADLSDIRLQAEAPDGWETRFGHPDDIIGSLPRGDEIAVPVTIMSPSDAPAGDYMVTVWAEHEQADVRADLRVMVTQPNIWGWVGIALMVLVAGGVVGLFLRLGRR